MYVMLYCSSILSHCLYLLSFDLMQGMNPNSAAQPPFHTHPPRPAAPSFSYNFPQSAPPAFTGNQHGQSNTVRLMLLL